MIFKKERSKRRRKKKVCNLQISILHSVKQKASLGFPKKCAQSSHCVPLLGKETASLNHVCLPHILFSHAELDSC